MGLIIIAEDAILIAMSLKQGMFKGQPRQISQGSLEYEAAPQTWYTRLFPKGENKSLPLCKSGKESTTAKELGMRYSSKCMSQPIQNRVDVHWARCPFGHDVQNQKKGACP